MSSAPQQSLRPTAIPLAHLVPDPSGSHCRAASQHLLTARPTCMSAAYPVLSFDMAHRGVPATEASDSRPPQPASCLQCMDCVPRQSCLQSTFLPIKALNRGLGCVLQDRQTYERICLTPIETWRAHRASRPLHMLLRLCRLSEVMPLLVSTCSAP